MCDTRPRSASAPARRRLRRSPRCGPARWTPVAARPRRGPSERVTDLRHTARRPRQVGGGSPSTHRRRVSSPPQASCRSRDTGAGADRPGAPSAGQREQECSTTPRAEPATETTDTGSARRDAPARRGEPAGEEGRRQEGPGEEGGREEGTAAKKTTSTTARSRPGRRDHTPKRGRAGRRAGPRAARAGRGAPSPTAAGRAREEVHDPAPYDQEDGRDQRRPPTPVTTSRRRRRSSPPARPPSGRRRRHGCRHRPAVPGAGRGPGSRQAPPDPQAGGARCRRSADAESSVETEQTRPRGDRAGDAGRRGLRARTAADSDSEHAVRAGSPVAAVAAAAVADVAASPVARATPGATTPRTSLTSRARAPAAATAMPRPAQPRSPARAPGRAPSPAAKSGSGSGGAARAARPRTATGDSTEQADDKDDEGGGESTSSRRRRRRRRSGEDGGDGGDDPQNTVTKVRQGRSAEDQITSLSGSTRLEAKKQRRREGREAGRRRAPIVSEAEFLARRESVDRVMAIRQRDDLTQIAVLEDKVLVEHYVARESQTSLIGNVYLGRVQNVLPSMEAAFIDIGKGRNAVLYAGEVNWTALGPQGRPAPQDRVGALVRPDDHGAGHQGPGRPQGRPAHEPDQPRRPVPRLRARRHQQRHLPQAARHRAHPAQDAAQGDRPRRRGRDRAYRRRGCQRGRADPRRRAAHGALGGHREEGEEGLRSPAPVRRARPDAQGGPRPVHRGLRPARGAGRGGLGDRPGLRQPRGARPRAAPGEARRIADRPVQRPSASTSRSPRASTARSGCRPAAR